MSSGSASPGFLSPSNALRRVPRSPRRQLSRRRGGQGSPGPCRCRPQGSCPSRRFWLRSRIVRTPRGARRFPWRPDASRPCSMPLASLESPFRAFPSRGAVPALAGLCFRVGSRSTAARRDEPRAFPVLSAPRRPFATTRPPSRKEGETDARAGTTVPATVEGTRVAASSPARTHRARRLAAGTPTPKLCSPQESVHAAISALARVRSSGRCSRGLLPL